MTLKTEAEITDRTINETPELTKFTNKLSYTSIQSALSTSKIVSIFVILKKR